MSSETSNLCLVIIGVVTALFSLGNLIVIYKTWRVVERYTDETQKMQEAVTRQSEQMVEQTAMSNKMYGTATKQVEQMILQTEVSNKMCEIAERQTNELIHQNRLTLLPAFAAKLKQDQSGHSLKFLLLTNIGNGIAVNVQISQLNFSAYKGDFIGDYGFKDYQDWKVQGMRDAFIIFHPIQKLLPGVEEKVTHENHFTDEEQDGLLLQKFSYQSYDFLSLLDERSPLQINFQDLEGNKYQQTITREKENFVPSVVRLVVEPNS